MRMALWSGTLAALITVNAAMAAPDGGPTSLSLAPAGAAVLKVASPAFSDLGDIPLANTQYGEDRFPGLTWSRGPAGTVSYVLILEDSDVVINHRALLHSTVFNIPATSVKLDAEPSALPPGAQPGPSYRGPTHAYLGPRTPPGPKHHYHFEVFALDTTLPGGAEANYAVLASALTGHVLAAGETVGLGEVYPKAPRRQPS